MNSRTMIGALALVATLAGAVQAETWFFTGNESSTDLNAWTDPTVWKDANGTAATAFNAADSYVLTNFGPGETVATVHALRAHGGTFANGARLELNANDGTSANRKDQRLLLYSDCSPDNPVVFTRGLLFGNNARIFPQNGSCTNVISGEVSLVAVNGGQIPTVRPNARNATLVFADAMTGGTGLGMFVFPGSDSTYRNFTLKFLGNVTWGGEMYVRDGGQAISLSHCQYNVRLTFGSITFTPSFRLDGDANGNFRANTLMRFAVDTVDDTVTFQNGIDVSKFPLHFDTYLEFPVDGTTGKAGKMVLQTQLYGRTNETIGVILTGNPFSDTVTNRFALMSVPVAYPLNASAFHLVNGRELDGTVVRFEVVNDATWSTLYAVVPPMVRYVQSDSGSQGANKGTHINQNDGWSDGAAAQSGKDYIVMQQPTGGERVLRTPDSNTSASYTFPCRSLTISANASLRAYVKELHIDDLRLLNGSKFYVPSAGGNLLTVTGNIDISGTARIGTYSSITMRLNNSFTGDGTIDFGGLWIAANAYATYNLYGDNSGFTGKMIVRTDYRDANVTPGLDLDCGNLGITNAVALGANFPTPVYDALVLTDYARFAANGVTIPQASNRGITIKDAGCIWVSSGDQTRIETPLTVDGTCYKRGVGTLTLAGPTRAVTGGGTDKCIIHHGLLRAAHADALKGLALEFVDKQNGASLMVMPDLSDADFTAKGIDLSGIDTPITLDAAFGGKIPFAEPAAADRPEAPFGVTEYGLLTVKATAADAVRAMLPTTPPRYFAGGRLEWMEKSAGDCVTFGVRCRRHAARIYLR